MSADHKRELPAHLVPIDNPPSRDAWHSMMIDSKVVDLLDCPISEPALRALSEVTTVPSAIKKAGNVFFYTVTGALTSPYTDITRFFVAGDYGRKTGVGDFCNLHLLAYVNEEPPYDVPKSAGQDSTALALVNVLTDKFSKLKKAISDSNPEHFRAKVIGRGDVLVWSNKGREMVVRLVPTGANPCAKSSNSATQPIEVVSQVLDQMSDPNWKIADEEKDAFTYCYFEEIGCRVLSSLPDLWIKFIKLCKYICAVHCLPLDSDFIENVALRSLIHTTSIGSWPHSKLQQQPKTQYQWTLLKFLEALGNVKEINKLDATPYPTNIALYLSQTDKISINGVQMENLNMEISDVHVGESRKEARNALGLSLRPLYRPFRNLGDDIEAEDWRVVVMKVAALRQVVTNDEADLKDLLKPIKSEEVVTRTRTSVLQKSERKSSKGRAVIPRILATLVLRTVIIASILFAMATIAYAMLIDEDGQLDPFVFEARWEQVHLRTVQLFSYLLSRYTLFATLAESSIFHYVEDWVEDSFLWSRKLPSFLNDNVPEVWKAVLVEQRANVGATTRGLIYVTREKITEVGHAVGKLLGSYKY